MDTNILKNYYIYLEYPINSLENDMALTIHWAVKKLFIDRVFSKQDVDILDYFVQGYSQREIANLLNIDRRYIAKRLKYILNSLSQELDKA